MNYPNLSNFTRESLITDARSTGIKNPHRLTNEKLASILYRYNQKAESFKIGKRFNQQDLKRIGRKQNLTENNYMKATKLNKFPRDNLQKIAEMRKIKNAARMDKEQLIYTLLRTTKNKPEAHYMKYITSNTKDELKTLINEARILFATLDMILTKEERSNLRQDLYKIESRERLTKTYYVAVLVTEAFGNNYEYHEINSDKDRNKSVKQYLYAIIPSLTKLINEKKTKSQIEQKIQLILHVRFNPTTDPTKKRTFCVKSDNIEIRQGIRTDEIIRQLIDSFLERYEHESNVLREGSNLSFECV